MKKLYRATGMGRALVNNRNLCTKSLVLDV